jgi:hypothetical protein
VVEPRREAMREVIRRGVKTGELRADTDVEVAMLVLTGTVLAREKAGNPDALNEEFATRVVDGLLFGLVSR